MNTKYIQYAIVSALILLAGILGAMSIKGWGWFLLCGFVLAYQLFDEEEK